MERKGVGVRRNGVAAKKKKKLVIKPFKKAPQLPENFESEAMSRLEAAVHSMHANEAVVDSTETLYSYVESLCNHNHKQELFALLQRVCEVHIRNLVARAADQLHVSSSSSSSSSSSGVEDADVMRVLPAVVEAWTDHTSQMFAVQSVFLYLDRTYVIQLAHTRTLWDMGLRQFCDAFNEQESLCDAVVHGMILLVNKDRDGAAVDRTALGSLASMMSALRLYGQAFELPFLEASRSYFEAEGKVQLAALGVTGFLRHVALRQAQEEERVDSCLQPSSLGKVRSVVQDALVALHADEILSDGFEALMRAEAKEELQLLFDLLGHVGMLPKLNKAWGNFIKTEGTSLVSDPKKDATMIESLLEFRARVIRVLEGCFGGAGDFADSMKDCFEVFINTRSNRPAELIAKFLDKQLRMKQSGLSDRELAGALDNVMELFRYVYGKDVFQEYYKKDLAKRLLLKKSANMAAEREMVGRIRSECGATFTTKLEGMFKDIELSKQLRREFEAKTSSSSSSSSGSPREFELAVDVLAAGSWPEYPPSQATLPHEVSAAQEEFRQFYINKHQSRKLTFQPSLSTCVLTANFPKGKKELEVSAYQAAVLCLFNASDSLTFKQIKERSGLPPGGLVSVTLQSLCVPKKGSMPVLLRRNSQGKAAGSSRPVDDDVFLVNQKFQHKLFRTTINSIQLKETKKEQKDTDARVEENRKFAIEASVVRIMKSRKVLSHQDLLAEVFPQLKFTATARDIKLRIENLIERDYLIRDENDRNLYKYLA